MKNLTALKESHERLMLRERSEPKHVEADRHAWIGCTGGEFSLDCPFCWHSESDSTAG
ncbi:hypothetical protein [Paenarthrobacter sp. NPDC090522]|uniref:hypothetical protein n=1 Tax=Paenarthrobacter sp. NPDC090522 TaxID=3364383 RepID=UPI00381B2C7A